MKTLLMKMFVCSKSFVEKSHFLKARGSIHNVVFISPIVFSLSLIFMYFCACVYVRIYLLYLHGCLRLYVSVRMKVCLLFFECKESGVNSDES